MSKHFVRILVACRCTCNSHLISASDGKRGNVTAQRLVQEGYILQHLESVISYCWLTELQSRLLPQKVHHMKVQLAACLHDLVIVCGDFCKCVVCM